MRVDQQKLQRLDRKRKQKRLAYTLVVLLLLCGTVLYGIHLEAKLRRLNEKLPVVIYKQTQTQQETAPLLTEQSIPEAVTETEEDNEAQPADMEEAASEKENTISLREPENSAESEEELKQEIYYITASGTKYHISTCSYLSKSKIEISLQELEEGGYEPCSRCIK